MPPKHRRAVRRKLLLWYEKNRRDLPWRRTLDPYAIWISETMLQQTRVSVVIPYYEKFLQEFPTVDALARARLQRVLRHWSGLGYYRRAEQLHRAARQISQRHEGALPGDLAALRALPGIGDYTAGALLSIAFGRAYPAIDGNARRVIGRMIGSFDGRKLRRTAQELVPAARPGAFNQALMELGATVCTPRNPRCENCAVRSLCAGSGRAAAPARREIQVTSVVWPLAIIRRGGKILLRRREAGGMLGGLWELPGGELNGEASIPALLRGVLRDLGAPLPRPRKLGAVRHAITHRRIVAPTYLFELAAENTLTLPRARWRWVDLRRLGAHATSSMTAKACRLLSP